MFEWMTGAGGESGAMMLLSIREKVLVDIVTAGSGYRGGDKMIEGGPGEIFNTDGTRNNWINNVISVVTDP